MLNLDGSTLKHQAETADGVLTLTASADGAILTGTLRALGYLQNQGIEKITFTDGTHTATIVLADLIAKGEARGRLRPHPGRGKHPDPERRSR